MNTDPGLKLSRIAVAACALAALQEPCGPPEAPAPKLDGGYRSGARKLRPYTECDRRAFEKRVAKRRAKKGYA